MSFGYRGSRNVNGASLHSSFLCLNFYYLGVWLDLPVKLHSGAPSAVSDHLQQQTETHKAHI